MKKRWLWKIATITVIILAIFEIIAGYLIFTTLTSLNERVQNSINVLEHITIPTPKDGKDATMQQVTDAVNTYLAANPVRNGVNGKSASDDQVQKAVNTYLSNHPIANGTNGTNGTDGKDGQNGQDGLTPQIRCNAQDDRWEVRYTPDDNWQLLNNEVVKCTVTK